MTKKSLRFFKNIGFKHYQGWRGCHAVKDKGKIFDFIYQYKKIIGKVV